MTTILSEHKPGNAQPHDHTFCKRHPQNLVIRQPALLLKDGDDSLVTIGETFHAGALVSHQMLTPKRSSTHAIHALMG